METLRTFGSIEDECCSEIKFQNLGEALRYGLVYELPEYVKKSEGTLFHLYGSIAYLYLNGYLSNQAAAKVDTLIFMGSGGEDRINGVVEDLSRLLFENLREKFTFDKFDELEEQLNLYLVPEWYFYIGIQLLKCYANNSYLCNGNLYYISSSDDDLGSSLIKMEVKRIWSNTHLEEDDDRIVLLNGFRKIYGLDTKIQRIYLDLYGQKSKFAYYDIMDDKLVICNNKFHALKDGNLFIVTNDNFVAVMMGNSIHKLKEYQENAKYDLRDDYFFVYPDELSNYFFYPYYLFFDGKVVQADKIDAKRVLWERITDSVSAGRDSVLSRYFSESADSEIPMPREVSISGIRETLAVSIPSSERCKSKKYVLLDHLFDIVATYIDEKSDITRLLYALCEANLRICKTESVFPSEELYWRLKEIAVENKGEMNSLATLLQNYNYEMLIKEIVKEKENKLDLKQKGTNKCRIGFLRNSNQGIRANCYDLEEGMFAGNQIIPIGDYSKFVGVISYDAYTNVVYVTTSRELLSEERLFVLKEFRINEQSCTFVIQPMDGIVNKSPNELEGFWEECDDDMDWERIMQTYLPDEEILD